MNRPTRLGTGVTVVLQVVVARSTLDTFDLWTRFEALPRLRRRRLLGDDTAVGRSSGRAPQFVPSAITVVEGPDGYAASVWIRSVDDGCSVVSLVTDDPSHAERAARDLARFVEFALVDAMELELRGWDLCECAGSPAPLATPASAMPAPEPSGCVYGMRSVGIARP